MAIKVIKGGTRMVEKTVCVEEKIADKFLLELTQDEVNALAFILGQRIYDRRLGVPSTSDIFNQLYPLANKKHFMDYEIVKRKGEWRVVSKNC